MEQKKTVAFCTLGCKLNFAETSAIVRQFVAAGYQKVDFGSEADVIVINTCSVTALADKKCRQAITKAVHSSPQAIVAVVGCYAQLRAEDIRAMKGVQIVLGAAEKSNVLQYVTRLQSSRLAAQADTDTDTSNLPVDPIFPIMDPAQKFHYMPAYSVQDRTRAFLKIQDGCDYRCAYCTVPLARGNSRNAPIGELIRAAQTIAAAGNKEIVITGVNIGDFGKTTGETFLDLIKRLDEVQGIERYRISSIEPNLLTDEIIDFVAHSRAFTPHFHIPLQSGSDEILQKMGRRYKREVFRHRVSVIKQLLPDAFIGVDVIVGFPGETVAHFDETYQFLQSLECASLHVFPYSERPNTRAISFAHKVPSPEKERRSHLLLSLSAIQKADFYRRFLQTTQPVLFEAKEEQHLMSGFTPNYIRVSVPFDKSLIGQIVPVKLDAFQEAGWVTGSRQA